ncbi:MAG: hypothetical protein HY360_12875 [Verrucomicrobia bacterium]|nr:hypothetical protein [Verrucomicrobiota bacterium]
MKNSILLVICVAALTRPEPAHAENAVSNGSFEADTAGWVGCFTTEATGQKKVKTFVSWEAEEGAGNTRGCLRANLQFEDQPVSFHNSGMITTLVKEFPKDAILKIVFSAKWVSGSKFLNVTRAWGGGKCGVVEMTPSWEEYDVEIAMQVEGKDIVFCTVPNKNATNIGVDGEFLLDDVSVEIKPPGK